MDGGNVPLTINPAFVVATVEPAAGLVMARPGGRLVEIKRDLKGEVGFGRESLHRIKRHRPLIPPIVEQFSGGRRRCH